MTVTGLAAGTKVGMGYGAHVDTDDYTGTLTVTLADVTGDSDNVTIEITDSAADAVNATLKVAATMETTTINVSSDDDGADSAELNVLNVKSNTLAVTHTLTTGTTTTVNLAADVMTLGTLSTDTSVLDASTFAGIISATTSDTGTTVSLKGGVVHDVTGGTGNDTFNISTTNADVAYNVDGTSGTDTLNMTIGSATVTDTNIVNFDTINYTVDNSKNAIVATVEDRGVNDEAATVSVSGGNTLSTFKMASRAIGDVDGLEATSLVTYNMDSFVGNSLLIFGDSIVDTDLTITGATGTDTVIASYEAAATEVLKVSAVENLFLSVDDAGDDGEAYIFNAASVTGANVIAVSAGLDTGDDANSVTISNLASGIAVGLGWLDVATGDLQHAAASELYGSITVTAGLSSHSGSTDALTVQVNDTNDSYTTGDVVSLAVTGLETLTLDVSNLAAEDHELDLSSVAATASSYLTVNVVDGLAGSDLVINNMSSTASTVDASTFLGDLIIQDRAATAMTITTAAGADAVKSAAEADVIDLGTGTDTLTVAFQAIAKAIDVDMSVAAGADMISVGGSAGTVQTNFENINLSAFVGAGANVTGSTGANTIVGSAYTDSINGGLDNDHITGGAGADYITGGGGDDTIVGAADANDTYNVDAGTDTITVFGGSDVLNVSAGATANVAVSSNFTATSGTQSVGTGTATLSLDNGVDADLALATVATAATDGFIITADTNAAASTIVGSDGNDTITAGDGGDTITGGAGVDTITGGTGNDTITGSAGDDIITVAAGGTNSVTGGTGADDITLGGGADTVVHAGNATDGVDTISGFTVGTDFLDINSTLISAAGGTGTDGGDDTYAASIIVDDVAETPPGDAEDGSIWSYNEQLTTTIASTDAEIVAEAVIQLADGNDFGTNFAVGEGGIIIMDDGTNSFIFEFLDADGGGVDAGEITLLIKLVGLADGGDLTATEFI